MSTEITKLEPHDLIKTEAQKAGLFAMQRARASAAHLETCDDLLRPFLIAETIKQWKEDATDMAMAALMSLAGNKHGFDTDKKTPDGMGTAYPVHVVRNAILSSVLAKVNVVGNEFNIIASSFYITKEGWDHKLRQLGAAKIFPRAGFPEDIAETATKSGARRFSGKVSVQPMCQINGETFSVTATMTSEVDARVFVTSFAGNVEDAIVQMRGKAEARALRMLYHYVRGIPEPSDEAGDGAIPLVEQPELAAIEAASGPVEPPLGERAASAKKAIDGADSEKALEKIMNGVKTCKAQATIDELEYDYLMKLGDEKRKSLG